MTAFDAEIKVTHIEVGVNEDNDRLGVNLIIGQALPLAEPGTDQPLVVPMGKLRFALDKRSAEVIGNQLVEEASKLKEASRLEVASDMKQAERVGSALKGIAGGR